MTTATLGLVLMAVVGCWVFGGIVLRAGGLLIAATGFALLLAEGQLVGGPLMIAGLAIWLVGHWHYALRHGFFKSAVAERLLLRSANSRRGKGG
jgi:hypothetical protein